MKFFFAFGIGLFMLYSLFSFCSFGYQSPRYIKLAHEITEKTAKKLKEQSKLDLVGTGGQMMDDIQMMAMSFYYYQEVTSKTARELIIHAIKEYLLETVHKPKNLVCCLIRILSQVAHEYRTKIPIRPL